jgi:hypothetical protein
VRMVLISSLPCDQCLTQKVCASQCRGS